MLQELASTVSWAATNQHSMTAGLGLSDEYAVSLASMFNTLRYVILTIMLIQFFRLAFQLGAAYFKGKRLESRFIMEAVVCAGFSYIYIFLYKSEIIWGIAIAMAASWPMLIVLALLSDLRRR